MYTIVPVGGVLNIFSARKWPGDPHRMSKLCSKFRRSQKKQCSENARCFNFARKDSEKSMATEKTAPETPRSTRIGLSTCTYIFFVFTCIETRVATVAGR